MYINKFKIRFFFFFIFFFGVVDCSHTLHPFGSTCFISFFLFKDNNTRTTFPIREEGGGIERQQRKKDF